ncbi:MAG: hypothetical protein RMK99_10145, partial [Anaerolineales bacterium]|nr:hypothetical protein [Anaerolineales bacterium]
AFFASAEVGIAGAGVAEVFCREGVDIRYTPRTVFGQFFDSSAAPSLLSAATGRVQLNYQVFGICRP